jgi:hypothetical protein
MYDLKLRRQLQIFRHRCGVSSTFWGKDYFSPAEIGIVIFESFKRVLKELRHLHFVHQCAV